MPTRTLTPADIRQLICYELGQAPASLYVAARSKSAMTREGALDALALRIAKRFEGMTVTHEVSGEATTPFARFGVPPKY
jgi:hypothetical protein